MAELRLRTNIDLLKTNLERLQRERQRLMETGQTTQKLRRKLGTASSGDVA